MSEADTPILPAHIQDTVRAIAQLHADHYNQNTSLQRLVDRVTAFVARPNFAVLLTAILGIWVALNLAVLWAGMKPWDAPPFNWVQCVTGVFALYTTVLILATQRREDQLAAHREQLTLELAILAEQKSAKIIQLLEEMRRDSPHLVNRIDLEAETMSLPADPQSVLDAIKDTHEELAREDRGLSNDAGDAGS
jgi:uncharacterized membrane protein